MNYWMGIDVSRATLEVALLDDRGERIGAASVKNEHKAVRGLLKRWTKEVGMANEQLLVCLEPTSHYSNGLLRWLVEAGVRVWLAHPGDIQHSVGSSFRLSPGCSAMALTICLLVYFFRSRMMSCNLAPSLARAIRCT